MAAIGSLVFCQSCGNLLDSANGDDSVVLTCDVCGAKCKDTSSTLITTTSKPSSFPSKLRDKLSGDVQQINVEDYSTEREFEITCPNACGAEKARYHEKQTRGADEGSTIFYTWNTNN
ncbi:hypothetical protein BLS_005416 [Venturia inaequalis]|uniref:DNA-directed RNA polymerase subunit n=1 Tax=Venturia inaequalis TaxID=5025 RepID=A0A8H3UG30_VENIN|nr:hypothetical protein BLS_005416 [Venturia inaequalis]RDI76290.1 hypothetical protein Vi05172_g13716 [Venturia inaequalis]